MSVVSEEERSFYEGPSALREQSSWSSFSIVASPLGVDPEFLNKRSLLRHLLTEIRQLTTRTAHASLTLPHEVIASDPFQTPRLWQIYDLLLNERNKQLNALYAIKAF
jgi:hypothetical protein